MLQTRTVYPETLALLNRLMAYQPINDFNLAGGTALALLYGHRISVDLDLFSINPFDAPALFQNIKADFSDCVVENMAIDKNSINLFINDIKVDFLSHQYPLIKESEHIENIRMFSVEDLIAMKTNATVQRGSKKDFMDLYEILNHHSIEAILNFYKAKYNLDDIFHAIRSLTYFDDAEISENPIILKKQDWGNVKTTITSAIKNYMSKQNN